MSYGQKLCSAHSGFIYFFLCYEMDFLSYLNKSKQCDLIDMLNDTTRYLDDIFTIDKPEFKKHIPNIYPIELQLNTANTSDTETFSLDLIEKISEVTFIPAFKINAMTWITYRQFPLDEW